MGLKESIQKVKGCARDGNEVDSEEKLCVCVRACVYVCVHVCVCVRVFQFHC